MYRKQGTGSKTSAGPSGISRGAVSRKTGGASKSTSKTTTLAPKPKTKPQKCAAKKSEGATKVAPQHAYPAFSVPQQPVTKEEAQKAAQKTIRRNKPPGEDVKKLTEIVKNIGKQKLEVQEFIALVAPSTGDNGQALLNVMADELDTFTKVTRKIYDTIGQDISDVLANEQLQYKKFTDERYNLALDRINRYIYEIQYMCPDFDYDSYVAEDNYLETMFPLEQPLGAEAEEALMRQATYHRYQWLRSEGERLREENMRLKKRLNQLKSEQRANMKAVVEQEEAAEETRQELEEEQAMLEEKLQELNESVGKVLVEAEAAQVEPINLTEPVPPRESRKPKRPKPSWASQQAAEIETEKVSEALTAETSKMNIRKKSSIMKAKKRAKRPTARKPAGGETSPFHFSPVKTPPRATEPASQGSPFHYSPVKTPPASRPPAAAEKSPFHFSPIKTPPQRRPQTGGAERSPFHYSPVQSPQRGRAQSAGERSPFHYSPPQPARPTSPFPRAQAPESQEVVTEAPQPRTRVTTSRVTTSRRCQAPRDTWGGFF